MPRSTPPGQHLPVMLDEVLDALALQPGQVVVDCTVGWAGHAAALLERVGTAGRLIGLDRDAENLPRARTRLEALGLPFTLHHANFAGLPAILATEGIGQVDGVVADLGMSSMQVDDPERGFSYARPGPLDMRMDRTRGPSATDLLTSTRQEALAQALAEFGDEPEAELIAAAIVRAREERPLKTTTDLVEVVRRRDWRGQMAAPSIPQSLEHPPRGPDVSGFAHPGQPGARKPGTAVARVAGPACSGWPGSPSSAFIVARIGW